jgi:hypothetical protein
LDLGAGVRSRDQLGGSSSSRAGDAALEGVVYKRWFPRDDRPPFFWGKEVLSILEVGLCRLHLGLVLDDQGVGLLDHSQGVNGSGEKTVVDSHVRADVGVEQVETLDLLMDGDDCDEVGVVC